MWPIVWSWQKGADATLRLPSSWAVWKRVNQLAATPSLAQVADKTLELRIASLSLSQASLLFISLCFSLFSSPIIRRRANMSGGCGRAEKYKCKYKYRIGLAVCLGGTSNGLVSRELRKSCPLFSHLPASTSFFFLASPSFFLPLGGGKNSPADCWLWLGASQVEWSKMLLGIVSQCNFGSLLAGRKWSRTLLMVGQRQSAGANWQKV